MIKTHNTRFQKNKQAQITSNFSEPSSENNVEISKRPKKLQKISQSEQASVTESEDLSSQASDDNESLPSTLLNCSSQEHAKTTNSY